MIGRAVEKGLTSLVARWMLEGQSDAILDRVLSAGALDATEVEALRTQTRVRLERLRDEGAPYAAMLGEVAVAVMAQAQASPMATALRASGRTVAPLLAQWLRAAAAAAESAGASGPQDDGAGAADDGGTGGEAASARSAEAP